MAAARIVRAWQDTLLDTGIGVSIKNPVGLSDINKSESNRRGSMANDDQVVLVTAANHGAGSLREKRVTRNTAGRGGGLSLGRGRFWRDCPCDRQLVVPDVYRCYCRGHRLRCGNN
jgi:hypothetical protein